MRMLHQHPDGLIFVRTDEGHYGETPANFQTDYGKNLPALPPGITERIYEPGKRHALVRGSDVVDGGPLQWPEGDAVLAKAKDLLARKKARDEEVLKAAKKKVEDEIAELKKQAEEAQQKAVQEFERINSEREAKGLPRLTLVNPPQT